MSRGGELGHMSKEDSFWLGAQSGVQRHPFLEDSSQLGLASRKWRWSGKATSVSLRRTDVLDDTHLFLEWIQTMALWPGTSSPAYVHTHLMSPGWFPLWKTATAQSVKPRVLWNIQRVASENGRFGRYPPLPRVDPNNDSVSWHLKSRLRSYPFDGPCSMEHPPPSYNPDHNTCISTGTSSVGNPFNIKTNELMVALGQHGVGFKGHRPGESLMDKYSDFFDAKPDNLNFKSKAVLSSEVVSRYDNHAVQ
ncbi:hypothetical protein E6O75_ATG10500 [Venturia nashicola]|uniref:Uncharacterized protein n=1 Tax=Venturia nashicola TaxID=86259 RepID=A0A4Z1P941_9PEZI|nr:hypothetical protein E6O75_ATG10500 [Venturia nashicola]